MIAKTCTINNLRCPIGMTGREKDDMTKEYTFLCLECMTKETNETFNEGGLCGKCGGDNFLELTKEGDISTKDLNNFGDDIFVTVKGGVAEVLKKPEDVKVHIIDFDNMCEAN